MTTQTYIKNLNKDIKELKEDIKEMKKFLFAPIVDSEGEYKESFVKKMLSRAQNRGPFYRFSDRNSFLKHVQSRK